MTCPPILSASKYDSRICMSLWCACRWVNDKRKGIYIYSRMTEASSWTEKEEITLDIISFLQFCSFPSPPPTSTITCHFISSCHSFSSSTRLRSLFFFFICSFLSYHLSSVCDENATSFKCFSEAITLQKESSSLIHHPPSQSNGFHVTDITLWFLGKKEKDVTRKRRNQKKNALRLDHHHHHHFFLLLFVVSTVLCWLWDDLLFLIYCDFPHTVTSLITSTIFLAA